MNISLREIKKEDFIIDINDSPEERKKKIEYYYYFLLLFLLISGFWPLIIFAVLLKTKVISAIENSINKNITYNKNNASTKKDNIAIEDTDYISYQPKTSNNSDMGRSILAVSGFIIFVLATILYFAFT